MPKLKMLIPLQSKSHIVQTPPLALAVPLNKPPQTKKKNLFNSIIPHSSSTGGGGCGCGR